MRRTLMLALAAGGMACGSLLAVGDEAPGGGPDASVPGADGAAEAAASSGDATADSASLPSCQSGSPFGAPTAVPWLTGDVNAARGSSSGRVYYSTGGSLFAGTVSGGAFLPTTDCAQLTNNNNSEQPTVTGDELTLFWQRPNANDTHDQIWVATRGSLGAAFGTEAPAPISGLAGIDAANVGDPYVVGSRIYLTIEPEGLAKQIWVGTLSGRAITGVAVLNSIVESSPDHPVVSTDEREIFYTSSSVLRHATRASATGPFAPANALVLPDHTNVKPTWLSPNGCDLYVVALATGQDSPGLFLLKRPPPQ